MIVIGQIRLISGLETGPQAKKFLLWTETDRLTISRTTQTKSRSTFRASTICELKRILVSSQCQRTAHLTCMRKLISQKTKLTMRVMSLRLERSTAQSMRARSLKVCITLNSKTHSASGTRALLDMCFTRALITSVLTRAARIRPYRLKFWTQLKLILVIARDH